MSTVEAFAHEMRGGITLFFLFWCFKLYPYARRSRMMRLLFISTLWITFGHLKDSVFLIETWKNSVWLDNVINVIDLIFIPLTCAFFLEATRPGFATTPRVAVAVGLQALFIPAYLIWPTDGVILGAWTLSYAMGALTTIWVVLFAARYHRYLSTHYSYMERLDVGWVVVTCFSFFGSLVIYDLAFDGTTWLSEALYNLFSLVLWTFLFLFARRHRIMRRQTRVSHAKNQTMDTNEQSAIETASEGLPSPDQEEEAQAEEDTDETEERIMPDGFLLNEALIATRLPQCMEQEQLYLNPRLSLREVATAIGSNMTYLSLYLNRSLNIPFYDYVNRYRVEEACRILSQMSGGERINMTEVAQQSGFNSISTFNRYFKKTKGVTPKEYYFNRI